MEHMSNLAGLGHTVIASIHQPRSAIWEMFDKVSLATPQLHVLQLFCLPVQMVPAEYQQIYKPQTLQS